MLQPLYNKGILEEGIIEALRHIDAFNDIETAKECLRTALSPNEKWAINLLNSSEGEGMKFKTLNGYPLPFFNNGEKRPEAAKGARLCVVYQVWGNHNYLKFLYLSVLRYFSSKGKASGNWSLVCSVNNISNIESIQRVPRVPESIFLQFVAKTSSNCFKRFIYNNTIIQ